MKKIPFIMMSAVMLVLAFASTADAATYYTITQVRKDYFTSNTTTISQWADSQTAARDAVITNLNQSSLGCTANDSSKITCTPATTYFWSSANGCTTAANSHGTCSAVNSYLNTVTCKPGYPYNSSSHKCEGPKNAATCGSDFTRTNNGNTCKKK